MMEKIKRTEGKCYEIGGASVYASIQVYLDLSYLGPWWTMVGHSLGEYSKQNR